jgi:glycosyltransferase involved in cell wall biosynthesis
MAHLSYTWRVKIALVCGSAGDSHCGVGDYCFELAQHLSLDAEVHLYHDRGHGPVAPPYEKLTTLHLHPVSGFSLLGIKLLAGQLSRGDYDIIHMQYPSKGYGQAVGPGFLPQNVAGLHSRSRVALTLHEWTTSHPLRRAVMDQMLPHVDALFVNSEQEMEALQGRMGERLLVQLPVGNVLRSHAELEVVWLMAAGQPVPQLPPPAGLAGREPRAVFHYGLPARSKGLERLLQALKLLREAGRATQLRLAGDYPPGARQTEELLNCITDCGLADSVVRLGHLPAHQLEAEALRCSVGVFPFDEGFSSKRSSIASISHLDLPLVVGGGSREAHPYYAPAQNTSAELAVLLTELFSGRLEAEWASQVAKQRQYAQRFSFGTIARQHLEIYDRLRKIDV